MVRSTLAELLGRIKQAAPRFEDEPDVTLLLDVDREYREKAALHKIAPKRFNETPVAAFSGLGVVSFSLPLWPKAWPAFALMRYAV
jgi:hypothetical protein